MKLEDFIEKHGNVSIDEKELKELLGIKDEKYFVPREQEHYWKVNHIGGVNRHVSSNIEHVIANNEVFKTEEEAKEHAKKQRFLLKMKRDFLDNSDVIDWNDSDQGKYILTYDAEDDEVISSRSTRFKYAPLATTNVEWLEEYIEKYEEEIKRYYFEIKEDK